MGKSNSSFWAIIAIFVAAGLFIYCLLNLVPSYRANQEALAKAELETDSAYARLTSLQEAKTDLYELGEIVDKIFVAIPGDKDEANLIAELEATAAKYGIVIPSIQISDENATLSTNAIPVAFAISGTFEGVSQFISSLEKDIRFTDIKSITLSNADSTMSLSIQMNVFKRSTVSNAATSAANQSLE